MYEAKKSSANIAIEDEVDELYKIVEGMDYI